MFKSEKITIFNNQNLTTIRTLLRVKADVEASNRSVADGTLPQVINSTIEKPQAEATYLLTSEGCRSCLIVFDLKDPSDFPAIAESFFMTRMLK